MSALPSISIASITIGFISFGLTLAIWLNAFWQAFLTVAHAPTQIQDELSVLRQQLYEEAEYLRRLRRRERRPSMRHRDSHRAKRDVYGDSGPVRVLSDAVKDLMHDFKVYEHPFLVIPGRTDEDRGEKDLEWSFDAMRQNYQCDLPRRLIWLRFRGSVTNIATKLERIQTHRAAIESTECRLLMIDCMGLVRECQDRMLDLDDRMRVIEDRLLGARVVRASGI
ncbi:putative Prion-inhibition and propagation HeLo domain-containing protein [Seiridium unicorne]|uniref:Prion-inhibition and propagation HeLo domain-containing protein n=1 Tax=Seiridium unicorne TaxID=138068 RepID=A0ABR2VA86_9PEZI